MADTKDALARAIQAAGGVARLAEALGIRPQAVSQWHEAPALRVIAIEAATAGRVTRYDLRPDVFGPAPSAPAATARKPEAA